MNILVIGNGFDLAHHLKTRYADFLHFIEAYRKYKKGLLKSDSEFYDEIDNLKGRDKVHFEEICTLVQNNKWITYFLSILDQREREGKTGWIDFESEISTVIQELDGIFRLLHENEMNGTKDTIPPSNICSIVIQLFMMVKKHLRQVLELMTQRRFIKIRIFC